MVGRRALIERERHGRVRLYFLVAFALGAFAYAFLGFDRIQTLGYSVASFIMLHVVNFRVMFAPLPPEQVEQQQPAIRDL